MRIIKTVLLIFISVLIVINGWLYLAWMSLERTVLSTTYLNDIATETDLVSTVHTKIHETLPALLHQNLPRAISDMVYDDQEDITDEMEERAEQKKLMLLNLVADALARTFNPGWLTNQFLVVTEDLLAFIKGEQQSFYVIIDLGGQKDIFQMEVVSALQALPEEKLVILGFETEEIQFKADQIQRGIALPNTFRPDQLLEEAEVLAEIEEILIAFNKSRALLLYWPYVFFALLMIFALLLAGVRGGLKWFGAATLLFSVPIFAGLHFFKVAISIALTGVTEIVLAHQVSVSPDLVNTLINLTIARISIIPLAFSVIGLLILAGNAIYAKIRGD